MKYLSITLVILLSGCVSWGAREEGNGDIVSESFDVSDFSKVRIGGSYSITLVPSDNEKVEVEIDDNLLEFLVVETHSDILEIYNTERIISKEGIDITIYYRQLEEITVNGACDLKNEDTLEGDNFYVEMSGAGAMDLTLDVKRLELDISGAGAVKLRGKTDTQRIRMSGAGGYAGFEFKSNKAKIDISGVGSADITVYEELDAQISGLGGINYKGNPEFVNSDVGGLGSIKQVD